LTEDLTSGNIVIKLTLKGRRTMATKKRKAAKKAGKKKSAAKKASKKKASKKK
jgi:hypothetical protein